MEINPVSAALGLNRETVRVLSRTLPRRRGEASSFEDGGDYLMSPKDIFAEGGPPPVTQYNWKCTNRYGWRDLIVKVGGANRVPRRRWLAWLDERSCAKGAE